MQVIFFYLRNVKWAMGIFLQRILDHKKINPSSKKDKLAPHEFRDCWGEGF